MNRAGAIGSTVFGLALLAFVFTLPSVRAVIGMWELTPEWILVAVLVLFYLGYEVIYRLILGKPAKYNYAQALLCVYVVARTILYMI